MYWHSGCHLAGKNQGKFFNSLTLTLSNTDENYTVNNRLVKFSSMEDTYQNIDVDNIHWTSFVVPYEHRNEKETYIEGCAKTVIVVSSMSLWQKLSIDYYDPKEIEEANNREDRDISVNDERYPFEGLIFKLNTYTMKI